MDAVVQQPPNIILGVPGTWASRTDVVQSIAGKSDGYLFAGMILMDRKTGEGVKLEVYDHDPRLRDAFTVAGCGKMSDADLDAIEGHTQTLYVIGPGGSLEAARKMMRAACGLLKAGGIAVKVESSGIAHSAETWHEMTDSQFLPDLHRAFVVQVGDKEGCFSCGMHNLGYRDAVVGPDDADAGYAAQLMHRLQMYELLENPDLGHGHTFSLDAESPRFRLLAEDCKTYPPGDPFHNPYGLWRLTRLTR